MVRCRPRGVVEQESPSPSVSDDGEEIKLVEDGEEEVRGRGSGVDQEIAAEHDAWEKCAESRSPSKPTLEARAELFEGDGAIEDSDAFIHQENFDRLLDSPSATTRGSRGDHRPAAEGLRRDREPLRFNSCAVVGNSGYMKMAKFGKAITHNLVLRLQVAHAVPFSELWERRRRSASSTQCGAAFASDSTGSCRWRGTRRFWSPGREDVYDNIVQNKARGPDVKVLDQLRMVSKARALLKQYRIRLCKAGYGPYKGGISPTSGFVASYFLRSICDRLSLYGLGTVDVPDVPYHYFLGTIGR